MTILLKNPSIQLVCRRIHRNLYENTVQLMVFSISEYPGISRQDFRKFYMRGLVKEFTLTADNSLCLLTWGHVCARAGRPHFRIDLNDYLAFQKVRLLSE
jgi:hypothetical protein